MDCNDKDDENIFYQKIDHIGSMLVLGFKISLPIKMGVTIKNVMFLAVQEATPQRTLFQMRN